MTLRWKIKTRRGKLDVGRAQAVWARFGKYVRPHRGALFLAFLSALGVIAAAVAAPWPIKVVFDYILTPGGMDGSWIATGLAAVSSDATSALAWVCGAILLVAVIDGTFAYTRDVLLAKTGQEVVGRIRSDLFAHMQRLAPADLDRYHTGGLLMRLTGDIQMLRQMLVNAVIVAVQSVLQVVAMAVVMFYLNPTLALIGMLTVPISLWASWRISRKIRKAVAKQRERESEVASHAHDVLGAMAIVQAFNREATEHQRFKRQNRSSIRAGLRATRLQSKLYRIVSFAAAAGICAILYVGVRSVLSGAMTAGDLLVFVSYLRAVNKPMRKMAKLAGQVAKATTCGQRIGEVFAIAPSIADKEDAEPIVTTRGILTFEDVTFCYEPGISVLSHVTLAIEPGERVAIVGHTGAGKSTLAKLILRFYDPDEGSVCIDGVDLRDVTLASLRERIGWVHQDTVLFGMTVLENIALGRGDADRALIESVARKVRAHEFIVDLPKQYDEVLGQGGSTLSGGQRQRLALARALLREPGVLMLDEPATGLDEPTRRAVEEAWMAQDNTATTLVICHRLDRMDRFDRIIVMRRGGIAGTGTHAELLANCTEYAGLHSAGADESDDAVEARAAC
ncbi:MAG: ABC transporter ATP-binding protein [Planctomycetes bacterium]|nr:ABC transporter ATP-binding protein [Planctomycetota bacterium]